MAFFEWSDQLSVKVGKMDEQHKVLVSLINELHEAMKAGIGKEATGKTLKRLIEYTKTHFADEEALMRQHGYQGLDVQKAEHAKLTQQVLDFNKDYTAGKITLTMEVMSFLKRWLNEHIANTDKKYGPYLNGKGIF
jgi:hemerythrin